MSVRALTGHPATVLELQRAAGNRAVTRMLTRTNRQALRRCPGRCVCGRGCNDDLRLDEGDRRSRASLARSFPSSSQAGSEMPTSDRRLSQSPRLLTRAPSFVSDAASEEQASPVPQDQPQQSEALSSPRFAGEALLEACFEDRARMTIGAHDTDTSQPVSKVQQALNDLGFDLGTTGANADGVDGQYGQKTAAAVRLFKRQQDLGFEQFGDVGPGTMRRLDELFPPDLPVCPANPDVVLAAGAKAKAGAGIQPGFCNPGFLDVTDRTFRIVGKSFIRTIGGRAGTGTLSCGPSRIDVTGALIDLAALTDLLMGETAPTDARDAQYRMFSASTIRVVCMGGRPISADLGQPFFRGHRGPPLADIDTDNGPEGPIPTPQLTVFEKSVTKAGPAFHFVWAVKGTPALVAEPAFQLVCPRASRFIWHRIEGDIDCNGLKNLTLSGSHFPTHRLFVDGVLQGTIPQGPFSGLWIPATPDPTMVK
jgi:peptidoglycan hydrolase-like protein with peptidoglycan-binding domain